MVDGSAKTRECDQPVGGSLCRLATILLVIIISCGLQGKATGQEASTVDQRNSGPSVAALHSKSKQTAPSHEDPSSLPPAGNTQTTVSQGASERGAYIEHLQGVVSQKKDLLARVSSLLDEAHDESTARPEGGFAMMVASYRESPRGIGDVVLQVLKEPVDDEINFLNPQGHVRSVLGDPLFASADSFLGLLYQEGSYVGPEGAVERQKRAVEAALGGDLTLLREQTVEPLHIVAVLRDAGQYLPGSLRTRVSSIVVNGELTFTEWRAEVGLIADDEETAWQVGTVVAAWRELAASLADTFASYSTGDPLRTAIKTSTVKVVDNRVVASATLPAATIVRVTKELAGHAPPDRITLCHKGRTIVVSENAVDAHLNHGDTLGPCDEDGDDCPTGGACGPKKVAICHVPSGYPAKAHTICVSPGAVPAHLAHGDYCGPCTGDGGGPPSAEPRGNNGLGNGTDPQPPGNPPINDGPGTSPGNPGRKA